MTAVIRSYWIALSQLMHSPGLIVLMSVICGSLITSWNIHQLKIITDGLLQSIANNRDVTLNALKNISPEPSNLKTTTADFKADSRPVVWINGRSKDHSYLKHIHRLFELHGYRIHKTHGGQPPPSLHSFDVLWNHEFPFSDPILRPIIDGLEKFQLINHVPGSGYYTSKVALASLDIVGIPPAFALPNKAAEFQKYVAAHPDTLWVQKSNAHRGIRVIPTKDIKLDAEGTFVQQFIRNPLLIDGRLSNANFQNVLGNNKKFDIGIYAVVTSISPLRVYIYDSDILLRFCSADHEPFNADNIDSYVVGDDYTPLWEMPSFESLYKKSGLSFKQAFNVVLDRKYGVDAEATIYSKIRRIIKQVFETQNAKMRDVMKNYRQKNIFFELSRFDFVVDENFNVSLMEANMSPNLSSGHFEKNSFLYEALLFDIMSLIGAGQRFSMLNRDSTSELNVISPARHLFVYSEECESGRCTCDESSFKNESGIYKTRCHFCAKCYTDSWQQTLRQTYNEHYTKRGMRRVVPPMNDDRNKENKDKSVPKWMTEQDMLLSTWLVEKCKSDTVFC